MEHKIATLEVYVSDADNGESSNLDVSRAAEGQYKIVLNPQFYGQVNWEERKHPWHSFAHELGHFLAELARRPSHHPFFKMLYPVDKEIEAWRIAHEEIPMPDPAPTEVAALGQYRRHNGL